MSERPYSRYTRGRTWGALYSQCVACSYALVPHSATNNSIAVIRCKTPAEAQTTMDNLLKHADECEAFYSAHEEPDSDGKPEPVKVPDFLARANHAVVLAKSSDYHHYHLALYPQFKLVICGLHDSYLSIPVLEMRTNKRYDARETSAAIAAPEFDRIRCTIYGHNILIGALLHGDQAARTFKADLPPRTQRRLNREVDLLQFKRYRGRPLAFRNEAERHEVGDKISASLKHYYAQKT